ncbi:MAG: peptidoglycan DD-metalloendopeptidase family protein [Oscillospiraceae bacterium]|jgi:murein DD-endopeptidase MepM/ murein hydrolase activator NlpD|nr:peptidoglycan DD-metalloendopeptidase family protein [Oscillospiraceae bacterium]
MDGKKTFFQRLGSFVSGKGFYVILFVCFATIGLSAYMLINGDRADTSDGLEDVSYETPGVPQPPAYGPAQNVSPSPPAQSGTKTGGDEERQPAAAAPELAQEPAPAQQSAEAAETAEDGQDGGDMSVAAPAEPMTFVWPIPGDIIFPYSIDELLYNRTMGDWRVHDGIDIAGGLGVKVVSAADGEVSDILVDDLLGTTVVIDHGKGITSSYSNLAATPVVQKGDKITMGAVIGALGDTALGESGEPTHLHLAMTKDGKSVNPADYLP